MRTFNEKKYKFLMQLLILSNPNTHTLTFKHCNEIYSVVHIILMETKSFFFSFISMIFNNQYELHWILIQYFLFCNSSDFCFVFFCSFRKQKYYLIKLKKHTHTPSSNLIEMKFEKIWFNQFKSKTIQYRYRYPSILDSNVN